MIADSSLGRRIPFGFLFEIKKRFLAQYPPESTDFASLPNYGAGSFNSELKGLMVEYGTTKAGKEDAISNVKGEIDNVRGIMSQNIESLLERGERIDLLVDKTDRLGGSAHDFRVRSRGLRRKMWWKVSPVFLFSFTGPFILFRGHLTRLNYLISVKDAMLTLDVIECKTDGVADCGSYLLHLSLCWVWMRSTRLVEMRRSRQMMGHGLVEE